MTKQAVGAMNKFLHESEMPRGHVEILLFTGDFASFCKYGEIHEDRIAHFAVERHRIFHFSAIRKAKCRRLAYQLDVPCITGSLSQFTKHEMACQNQRARTTKTVL